MISNQYDDSIGVDPLMEAETGSPFEESYDDSAGVETSDTLETELNRLVNEHGLIEILESLKSWVQTKAEVQRLDEQAEAFKDVARALTVLIKALPPELDIEIALEQIAHTSRDVELD